MKEIENTAVREKFQSCPEEIRLKLLFLRSLILKTAKEISKDKKLEETLKWGEPSYLLKGGSTIRIDWKASSPDQYCMYFNCKTSLVDTFKELYRDSFSFAGNRAIVFDKDEEVAVEELRHCIALTLQYHKIKHLPLLGA